MEIKTYINNRLQLLNEAGDAAARHELRLVLHRLRDSTVPDSIPATHTPIANRDHSDMWITCSCGWGSFGDDGEEWLQHAAQAHTKALALIPSLPAPSTPVETCIHGTPINVNCGNCEVGDQAFPLQPGRITEAQKLAKWIFIGGEC